MKKVLIVVSIILGLLLIALLSLPIIFKGKIEGLVTQQINNSINAKAHFDPDKFSLSLIRRFPNASVKLGNFGITGIAPFEGDTLAHIESFEVVVDLFSLFGPKINVKRIILNKPYINAIILPTGEANFDIAKPDTTTQQPTDSAPPAKFAVAIKRWEINQATISFADAQNNMVALVRNLTHTGSGDLTQDIIDIKTLTTIDELSYEMAGVRYLSKHKFEAKIDANLDLPNAKYTLSDNSIKINQFELKLAGWLALPPDSTIQMDLALQTPQTNFKDLLSLVPSVFLQGFDKIETDGTFKLASNVKGTFNPSTGQLPAFNLDFWVDNGKLKYPDLPMPVSDIFIDLNVDNKTGEIDKTYINLKNLALNIGQNPIKAKAIIDGLNPYKLDVDVNAALQLDAITKAFPIDGLNLSGLLNLQAKAKGVMDTAFKQLPNFNVALALTNGYVKSKDFPRPIEKIGVKLTAENQAGNMAATSVNIDNIGFELDGQPFNIAGKVSNFDNITYDIKAKGTVDFEKILAIFPVEGMNLKGILTTDIHTSGQMDIIEKQLWDQLPTSGTLQVANLSFSSKDFTQGLTIAQAQMEFKPEYIALNSYTGTLGKSDLQLDGRIENYLGFVFKPKTTTLVGYLNLNSRKFDVNEWMPAPAETPTEQPTAQATPLEIPRNIKFNLNSVIGRIEYATMPIDEFKGVVRIEDGIMYLDRVFGKAMGGEMLITGNLNTQIPSKPSYDFGLKLTKMSIPQAYKSFNTVKAFAPAAENITGDFSTDFRLAGNLKPDMTADLSTVSGGGLLNILEAALSGNKLVSGINSLAKTSLPAQSNLYNLLVKAEIRNGRAYFQPFDMNMGGQKVTIGGSNGLDGTIDYIMSTEVPGTLLSGVAKSIPGLSAFGAAIPDRMLMNFGVGGTYLDPKIKLTGVQPVGGSGKSPVQSAFDAQKQRANDEAERLRREAEQRAKAEADRLRNEAEQRARAEADRLKKEAEDKAKKELEKLKRKIF